MTYDATRHQTVLFGGYTSPNVYYADTWVFDGVNWTNVSPATSPSARGWAGMAYSAVDGYVYLFGGNAAAATLSDTWRWNGSTWTLLAPSTVPPNRSHEGFVYDAARGRVTMFAGEVHSAAGALLGKLNDTWAFTSGNWVNLTLTTKPTVRTGPQMSYDPVAQRIVMFGGNPNLAAYATDTWTFNGTAWTQQFPVHRPSGRAYAAMAWDATLGLSILYGGFATPQSDSFNGPLWAWTGSDWLAGANYVSDRIWTMPSMAPSPANAQLVKFGGTNTSGALGGTYLFDWGGLGTRRGTTFDTFAITDRSNGGVNVASGDLNVQATDVTIAAPGLAVSVQRSYNSRTNGKGLLGSGWTLSVGADAALADLPNGSMVLYGLGGGDAAYFAWNGTVFVSPPGWDAVLATGLGGTFDLTENGSGHRYHFDASKRLASESDRSGNTMSYNYNADGTIASIVDTAGRTTGFAYLSGKLTTITDPSSRTYQYGYDANGDLHTFTDSNNKVSTFDYTTNPTSQFKSVTKVTSPEGRITDVTYATDVRVTSIGRHRSTGAFTTTYRYDPRSATETGLTVIGNDVVTNPALNPSTYTYDAGFRVDAATDPLGHPKATTWTSNNNVATTKDALGGIVTLNYNVTNSLTSIVAPPSGTGQTAAQTTFSYATPGSVSGGAFLASSRVDAQGNCRAYTYNTNGNPATVYDGLTPTGGNCDGATSANAYTNKYQGDVGISCLGKPGQLCRVIDAKGTTSFAYDATGNLQTITPPAPLGATTITYDGIGRPTTVTDGRGKITRYSYDPLDRVTQILYDNTTTCDGPHATCIHYDWNADGTLADYIDNTGTISYTWDERFLLTVKAVPGLSTTCVTGTPTAVTLAYDDAGNTTSYCDDAGPVGYFYDAANRLVNLAEVGGTCTAPTSKCTTFTYNSNDQRLTTTYPTNASVTLHYNGANQLDSIVNKTGLSAVINSFAYSYNQGASDRTLRQTMTTTAGTVTFGYDSLSRLTSANGPGSATASWTYDGNGNRLTQTINSVLTNSSYNNSNELTSGTVTPTYDGAGNQTTAPNGNTYVYSAKGQNSSATPLGGTSTTYAYAGADSTDRTASGSTSFLNSPIGVTRSVAGATTTRYVREPSGQLLALVVGGHSYYYGFDGIGSIAALTNDTGATANTYGYDAWGNSSGSTEAVSNPWRYAAGYLDSASGLTKFGTRYYDTTLGRWTQQDSLSGAVANPTTLNRYAYASGSPVNNTDPSGRCVLGLFGGGCDNPVSDTISNAVGNITSPCGLAWIGLIGGAVLALTMGPVTAGTATFVIVTLAATGGGVVYSC